MKFINKPIENSEIEAAEAVANVGRVLNGTSFIDRRALLAVVKCAQLAGNSISRPVGPSLKRPTPRANRALTELCRVRMFG